MSRIRADTGEDSKQKITKETKILFCQTGKPFAIFVFFFEKGNGIAAANDRRNCCACCFGAVD